VAVRCTESLGENWIQPTGEVFRQREGTHVWCIRNNTFSKDQIAILWEKLSFWEKEKALRFHFERDRIRYVLTHGILRELLGKYLDCEERDLIFCENKFGKPFLENSKIEFNISHSGNMILLSFNFYKKISKKKEFQIGVDLEKLKEDFEYELVLDSFFTQKEKNIIRESDDSINKFFKLWTQKEALVKMTGTGLTESLRRIDISKNKNKVKLQEEDFSKILTSKIFIHTFQIKNYTASIASKQKDTSLRFYKY